MSSFLVLVGTPPRRRGDAHAPPALNPGGEMFVKVIQIVGLVVGPVFACWVVATLVMWWRFRHFSTRARRVEARIQMKQIFEAGGAGKAYERYRREKSR